MTQNFIGRHSPLELALSVNFKQRKMLSVLSVFLDLFALEIDYLAGLPM
jgi:hypothetical protein